MTLLLVLQIWSSLCDLFSHISATQQLSILYFIGTILGTILNQSEPRNRITTRVVHEHFLHMYRWVASRLSRYLPQEQVDVMYAAQEIHRAVHDNCLFKTFRVDLREPYDSMGDI